MNPTMTQPDTGLLARALAAACLGSDTATTQKITATLAALAANLETTQEQLSTFSTISTAATGNLTELLADTWHEMPRGISYAITAVTLSAPNVADKTRAELTAYYAARKNTNPEPEKTAHGGLTWQLSTQHAPFIADRHTPTWWSYPKSSTMTDNARRNIEQHLTENVLHKITGAGKDARLIAAIIGDAHAVERARRAAAAVQRCRHTLDDLVRGIER